MVKKARGQSHRKGINVMGIRLMELCRMFPDEAAARKRFVV